MKQKVLLFFLLILILSALCCKKGETNSLSNGPVKAGAGGMADISDESTLIISGHFERPPFDWQEDEKLSGAGIEILSLIMGELGVQTDPQYRGPWKRVLDNLEKGKIDVMCGLYETEERKQFAVFSEPFSEDQVTVFVWHDRSFSFDSWNDLKGKVFGEVHGASRGKKFDDFRKEHCVISYAGDHKFNFKKLEAGRIDCIVTSYYLGLMYIKKLGYEGKIIPLKKPVAIKYLRYAFSKRSGYVDYIPYVNSRLAKLRKEGKLDRIISKNLDFYVETYFND